MHFLSDQREWPKGQCLWEWQDPTQDMGKGLWVMQFENCSHVWFAIRKCVENLLGYLFLVGETSHAEKNLRVNFTGKILHIRRRKGFTGLTCKTIQFFLSQVFFTEITLKNKTAKNCCLYTVGWAPPFPNLALYTIFFHNSVRKTVQIQVTMYSVRNVFKELQNFSVKMEKWGRRSSHHILTNFYSF